MPTQTKKPLRPELIMLIIALVCAGLLIAVTVLSLPYIQEEIRLAQEVEEDPEDPENIDKGTPPPSNTIPTDPAEPALLPLEKNPYDRYDFQYDGKFLKLQYDECRVGIDVSYHQREIDWEQVAATDVELVMVRAGYRGYGKSGKLVEDELAKENIKQARKAGLDVGAYFFSQAVNVEEAEEEARMLLDIIKGLEITLPVVYDWEYISAEARTANVDPRTLTDCALAFCAIVEDAGYTPMVYFNTYQGNHMMYLAELKQYDFWLAWYSDRMVYPYKLRMWQYTDSGRVPGIQGNVDLNVWFPE